MSTEDSDESGIVAPNVNTRPRVHNVSTLRGGDWQMGSGSITDLRENLWMEQYGGERNLFDALGYIKDPEYKHYRSRYARTDTAPAIVDKLPKKAWKKPTVVDTGKEDGQSEFEKVVDEFLSGEYTEEDPINVFERAARMERLGRFSLIFLGLTDEGASPDEGSDTRPEDLLRNAVEEGDLEDKDPEEAISYIKPYDEGRVDRDEIDWVDDDPTDPRFGKPRTYEVDMGENRPVVNIHWSRVIHVVGNIFDDHFESPSVLKQSLNRIDDIEKILGGSAEGYWRSAYQGLVISPPEINDPELPVEYADFSDDGEQLHKQINRYINNFSREIFTEANIDPIEANAQSPMEFIEAQYRDISAGHDIPQSILMGNETGERATEEDREMWHERVGEFRDEYCEPAEFRPTIDRLVNLGVFPEPEGGPGGYRVLWPPLDEKSEKEEWEIRQIMANTIQVGTGGSPMAAMSIEEFRKKVLGWDGDIDGESPGEEQQLDSSTTEDITLDEAQSRVQEQFRLNASSGDWVDTPDGKGLVDDKITEGEVDGKEASSDKPIYAVVMVDEATVNFYPESDISAASAANGPENPKEQLKENGGDRENSLKKRILNRISRKNQEGHFEWPESWKESDTPARVIALKAWAGMGAQFDCGGACCVGEMTGEIASPERFCADFKDRIYGTEKWRGGWV